MSIQLEMMKLRKLVEFITGVSPARFELEAPAAVNEGQWVLQVSNVAGFRPIYKDDQIEVCVQQAIDGMRAHLRQRKMALGGELRQLEGILSE